MIVRITRVKVGNRQAPRSKQKPHPEKVGFLRLPKRYQQRQSSIWVSEPKRNAAVSTVMEG
jgi:hypothetical protein